MPGVITPGIFVFTFQEENVMYIYDSDEWKSYDELLLKFKNSAYPSLMTELASSIHKTVDV